MIADYSLWNKKPDSQKSDLKILRAAEPMMWNLRLLLDWWLDTCSQSKLRAAEKVIPPLSQMPLLCRTMWLAGWPSTSYHQTLPSGFQSHHRQGLGMKPWTTQALSHPQNVLEQYCTLQAQLFPFSPKFMNACDMFMPWLIKDYILELSCHVWANSTWSANGNNILSW